MLTDDPLRHEQLHRDLLLTPKYTSLRPTSGNRVGERRLDPTGVEYYWNGGRWLSVQEYSVLMSSRGGTMPFAQATSFFDLPLANHNRGGTYLTGLSCTFKSGTVQSGTNYYTTSLSVSNSTTVTAVTLSGTTTTQTFTNTTIHNAWEPTVTATAFDNSYYLAELTLTPTGAPGTFIFFAVLTYRLIG